MADFHLDHNIAVVLSRLLRAMHYTAVGARELGLARGTDDAHLALAAMHRRILVT